MRRLGWRARKIRLGRETRNGYCRKVAAASIISQSPGLPPGARADEAPLAGHPGDMAAELEAVAQLGLKNLRDILTAPLDYLLGASEERRGEHGSEHAGQGRRESPPRGRRGQAPRAPRDPARGADQAGRKKVAAEVDFSHFPLRNEVSGR